MMKEALKVIEAWGFTYKSIAFQWVKQNRSGNGYFFGLGRWTRGNTEPCLLAVKGKPKRISASVGQLVFSPLRRHSQKPDEVRDRIVELMGDLPRIELFARETAPGWDSWGNEVPTPAECEETMNNNNKSSGSTGGIFWMLLAVAFIVLKVTHLIDWPWVWVLAPIWIPTGIVLAAIVIVLIVVLTKEALRALERRSRR